MIGDGKSVRNGPAMIGGVGVCACETALPSTIRRRSLSAHIPQSGLFKQYSQVGRFSIESVLVNLAVERALSGSRGISPNRFLRPLSNVLSLRLNAEICRFRTATKAQSAECFFLPESPAFDKLVYADLPGMASRVLRRSDFAEVGIGSSHSGADGLREGAGTSYGYRL